MGVKVELDLDDCDDIVIAALQQSGKRVSEHDYTHPKDIKYFKKYRKAVNRVLRHFGGDEV